MKLLAKSWLAKTSFILSRHLWRELHKLSQFYKIAKNLAPHYLIELFPKTSSDRTHSRARSRKTSHKFLAELLVTCYRAMWTPFKSHCLFSCSVSPFRAHAVSWQCPNFQPLPRAPSQGKSPGNEVAQIFCSDHHGWLLPNCTHTENNYFRGGRRRRKGTISIWKGCAGG